MITLAGIGGILSGLGGLGGLLGALGLGRKNVPFVNPNPYTDKTFNQYQNQLAESNKSLARLFGRSEGFANQITGVRGELENLFGNIGALQRPNIDEGFNLFQKRTQPLLDLGQRAAETFTRPYREEGKEIADRRASQAAQRVMSQFGGAGFSGAAKAAASGAASDVFKDYETNLAQMFGQIGSNVTNQALGQERGLSENAPQQRFANALNQILQQAQVQQTLGSLLGNQAGMFGNLAGIEGNRANTLLNNIGALSRPMYTEQIQENPFAAFSEGLGGMGDMFSNPDFVELFKGA